MNVPRRLAVLVAVMVFAGGLAMPARAATSTIGILVYDGFLTSDVTAPVEVLAEGCALRRRAHDPCGQDHL